MSFHVLGVRHHGPGSARAVLAALAALQPDRVLVEGPPDADAALEHLDGLVPPVALAVHDTADARRGGFWPFAEFSPEWQALTWARRAGVPVSFCDLPQTLALPLETADDPDEAHDEPGGAGDGSGDQTELAQAVVRADPFGWIAAAMGHDDPERWWEDLVEHRRDDDPLALFEAITEIMSELRAHADAVSTSAPPSPGHRRDLLREAAMRQTMRAAAKSGAQRIAVVCGAWHAPALSVLGPASADTAALRGLKRTRTGATWVPWTYDRLAAASGYGAGVTSPGWYEHLWTTQSQPAERWLTRTATLLRGQDLSASPASVVEAVLLAEALAALRGRTLPGLEELNEATLTVLCNGSTAPLQLVRRELLVGDRYGQVPDSVPTVPLQADLAARAKRLRLPMTAAEKVYDLDLRRDNDLERSQLLHRLAVLGVRWGSSEHAGGTGTFRERWALRWQPEHTLAVIDACRYGRTVEAASTARLTERAQGCTTLPHATGLSEVCLLAELTGALPDVSAALDRCAATTSDVVALLAGIAPLVRALRYGTVRSTDTTLLRGVLDSLLERACANLVAGLAGLDADGSRTALTALQAAHPAVALLDDAEHTLAWHVALGHLAALQHGPGLLRGWANRTLLDANALDADACATRLAHQLSRPGLDPEAAVSWLEGFLTGSAVLLMRDAVVFGLVDDWLACLPEDVFVDALPLLRRAFASFEAAERRQLGALAAQGGPRSDRAGGASRMGGATGSAGYDLDVGAALLARVRDLLGISSAPDPAPTGAGAAR